MCVCVCVFLCGSCPMAHEPLARLASHTLSKYSIMVPNTYTVDKFLKKKILVLRKAGQTATLAYSRTRVAECSRWALYMYRVASVSLSRRRRRLSRAFRETFRCVRNPRRLFGARRTRSGAARWQPVTERSGQRRRTGGDRRGREDSRGWPGSTAEGELYH